MSKYPDNYLTIPQHSPEWYQARVGLVTASRVADAINFTKAGKSSAKRDEYKMELLQELLTGQAAEHFVTMSMQFGIDNEANARTAYEMAKGWDVERMGFVFHPHFKIDGRWRAGASPDGLVGDDGLVELKVPNTATHLQYLIDGVVPEQYKAQMLFQMACTEREWCDFVSYDPRLPDDFSLFIVRYARDDKAIASMEAEVHKFILEVSDMSEKLLAHRREDAGPPPLGPPRAEIPEWEAIT